MSELNQIPKSIQRASHTIGCALWLDAPEHWLGVPTVLRVRLSPRQRVGLAYACLKSLSVEDTARTVDAAVGSAGAPIAPLLGVMDEARHWAGLATSHELSAYAAASFERLAPHRQGAFLDYAACGKAGA